MSLGARWLVLVRIILLVAFVVGVSFLRTGDEDKFVVPGTDSQMSWGTTYQARSLAAHDYFTVSVGEPREAGGNSEGDGRTLLCEVRVENLDGEVLSLAASDFLMWEVVGGTPHRPVATTRPVSLGREEFVVWTLRYDDLDLAEERCVTFGGSSFISHPGNLDVWDDIYLQWGP